MIQDIAPKHLFNQYERREITNDAYVCVFRDKDILALVQNGEVRLPTYGMLKNEISDIRYLFSVDNDSYFLALPNENMHLPEGYMFDNVRSHRTLLPMHTIYAEMTAWHLYIWYRDNHFCGRCATKTVHDEKLRMLKCPKCGNMIFPKICPAVIVGVTHNDKILLTKYAGRGYKNYALIAGFIEIGETAEEAVMREVYEETGVNVKNIRYWATQPWGIDTDLLLGYFAELDGDSAIHMDKTELSLAGWYARDEIDFSPDNVSLTNNMIAAFIDGRYNK